MPHMKTWRLRHRLTQAALAAKVGVDTSTIGHIEINRRKPSIDLLQRICDALDLSPQERLEAAGLSAPADERREAA